MPAGVTYDALTTTTISSTTSSITLSSIDQTYTDLVLVCNFAGVNSASYVGARFNGDTGNNYNSQRFYSVSNAFDANHYSLSDKAFVGSVTASNRSALYMCVQNYANTGQAYKPIFSMDNSANFRHGSMVSTWASTAAITSITLICPDASGFTDESIISLYGIKAA